MIIKLAFVKVRFYHWVGVKPARGYSTECLGVIMLMVCPKRQVSKSKAINQGYYRLQHSASPTYVVGREAGREIQTTLLCGDMNTSYTVLSYRQRNKEKSFNHIKQNFFSQTDFLHWEILLVKKLEIEITMFYQLLKLI